MLVFSFLGSTRLASKENLCSVAVPTTICFEIHHMSQNLRHMLYIVKSKHIILFMIFLPISSYAWRASERTGSTLPQESSQTTIYRSSANIWRSTSQIKQNVTISLACSLFEIVSSSLYVGEAAGSQAPTICYSFMTAEAAPTPASDGDLASFLFI